MSINPQVFRMMDFFAVVRTLQIAQNRGYGAVATFRLETIREYWGPQHSDEKPRRVDLTIVSISSCRAWEAEWTTIKSFSNLDSGKQFLTELKSQYPRFPADVSALTGERRDSLIIADCFFFRKSNISMSDTSIILHERPL